LRVVRGCARRFLDPALSIVYVDAGVCGVTLTREMTESENKTNE